MHGGVWEWTGEEWVKDTYQLDADQTVTSPHVWKDDGRRKVVRGGSFEDAPLLGRSAQRYWREPGFVRSFLGFRVSMSVDAVRTSMLAEKSKTGANEVSVEVKPAVAPFDASQARALQEAWAKHRTIPVEFVNSIGMRFRLIPPGRFVMGSTPDEITAEIARTNPNSPDAQAWIAHLRDEGPQHEVELTEPYYAAVYEVTQSEYERVMLANPSSFTASGNDKDRIDGIDTRFFPVESVSWNDAVQFCDQLSLQEDRRPAYTGENEQPESNDRPGYRLLTEAEWEFACRAGTTTAYWSGPTADDLAKSDWYNAHPDTTLHAVGTLLSNPFGLFDVHGNVTEWCHDGFEINTYLHRQEPITVNPVTAFEQSKERIFRGGSFYWGSGLCRSGHRHVGNATHKARHIGFRIMLPAVQSLKK